MTSAYTYRHSMETDAAREAIWALYEPSRRLRLTYTAEIDGPADEVQQLGPMITADFPDRMASLIALAEERSS